MGRERIERVFNKSLANGGNVAKAMREEKYSKSMTRNSQKIKQTKTWQQLMDSYIPDTLVARTHKELFHASAIDHMVYPLSMTDKEITQVVESIKGCKVKKIKRGEQAVHVYFWIPNSKARKEAVELAYKIRGRFAPTEIKVSPLQKLSDEELAAIASGEAELEDEG